MENSYTPQSAAHLRHALRTPLNHIIGYSEIVAEDIRDSVLPNESAWALPVIDQIVLNSRELVRFVQNALPSSDQLSEKQVRDLQSWLYPHLLGMIEQIAEIRDIGPHYKEDITRVDTAARKLLAFCAGNPEALDETAELPGDALQRSDSAAASGRLLVADDSPQNRDILRRSLERAGFSVETVGDGLTALESVRQSAFDLVLLDVVMPGADGYAVLRELKNSNALKAIPVIVISALDETSTLVRCVQLGAEDYIMKPFDAVLVRLRVKAALDRRRALARLACVRSQIESLRNQVEHGVEVHAEQLTRLAETCDADSVDE